MVGILSDGAKHVKVIAICSGLIPKMMQRQTYSATSVNGFRFFLQINQHKFFFLQLSVSYVGLM
jgi:hypothetical protein